MTNGCHKPAAKKPRRVDQRRKIGAAAAGRKPLTKELARKV